MVGQNIPGWCVVIAKPMSEQIAAKSIRERGYREYLPMCQRVLRGKGHRKGEVVLYPLFPRYLFAELHPDDQWSPIAFARGVDRLIMWGEKPALVRDSIIEEIRRAERENEFDERKPGERVYPVGSVVRVCEGPFASHIATIAQSDEMGRVVALLNILGAERRVRLRASEVEAMELVEA